MKTNKLFIMPLLSIGLLVTGAAQAFCFSSGSNHNRTYGNYNYPMPAVGFSPQPYYAYPYSETPLNTWYGDAIPVTSPGPQDTGLYRRNWR